MLLHSVSSHGVHFFLDYALARSLPGDQAFSSVVSFLWILVGMGETGKLLEDSKDDKDDSIIGIDPPMGTPRNTGDNCHNRH
jgi:hypothetical protein